MAKRSKTRRHTSAKEELFSQYVARIETSLLHLKEKRVILSTDIRTRPLGGGRGIKKLPIVWPLYQHNMFYIVTIPEGTRVRRHKHDEDVFRYIIEGSLIVTAENKRYEIREGMWFV